MRQEEGRQGKALVDLDLAPLCRPIGLRVRFAALAVVAFLACIVALSVSLALAPGALAARGHEFASSFGTPCGGGPCAPGELSEPSALAVNEATGEVYVLDQGNDRVQRFSSAGAFLGGFSGASTYESEPGITEPTPEPPTGALSYTGLEAQNGALAVDNDPTSPSRGDVYVADAEHQVIDKFSPAGEYLGQLTAKCPLEASTCSPGEGIPFERKIHGVAVDPQGHPWVYLDERTFTRYSGAEPNLLEARTNGFSNANGNPISGFAVDGAADFYVRLNNGTDRIAKLDSSAIFLDPELDPEESSAVAVDPASSVAYIDNLTSVGAFDSEAREVERLEAAPLGAGEGVGVNAASGHLYVADASGIVLDFAPQLPGPPSIEAGEQYASAVNSSEAEVHSALNPQSEAGEAPTGYAFEYGPCPNLAACSTAPYPFSAGAGSLAPDFEVHAVARKLTGLDSATTYHWRLTATNEHEGHTNTVHGAEGNFTTEPLLPFSLPDGRQWEMVSPPAKFGARIEPLAETGVIEAAADGSAITYLASTPTEATPPGYTNLEQVLSRRGATAWSGRDIGIPHEATTGLANGPGPEYKFFDPGLTLAAVQPFGPFDPPLSAAASESTAYLHDLSGACGTACYQPLVTAKPGFANVPEGTHFGQAGEENCEPGGAFTFVVCGPRFLGASEGLGHVVLSSPLGLELSSGEPGGLYEWSGGSLARIGILPDGEPGPANSVLGAEGGAARGAVSADGSRIFWSASGALYLRANATAAPSASGACDEAGRACTIQLDALTNGPGASGGGVFQLASADGSRAFFTDTHRLTANSGAGENSPDLYECRIVEPSAGEPTCQLTDLTPEAGGEAADVRGAVLGAAEDGSYLYFVADGDLASNAVDNGAGPEEAEPGRPNLYLLHAGAIGFIAGLSAADEHDWFGSSAAAPLSGQPTRVSADGRFLAFMSQGAPTGYDNRDLASGKPVAEVYLYDASAGQLHCASCEPTGARPHGVEYHRLEPGTGGLVGGPRDIWPGTALVAANVPGWTQFQLALSRYQPRYLNDQGRLFFNSADPLVPADSNGTEDVFEYEPPGAGGCSASDPTYSERSGGCVGLISAGTSGEESAFLDASESGEDVFFLTASRLAGQDNDSQLDVYDAHACTSESPCLPEPSPAAAPCAGESCRASVPPPAEAAPQTQLFSGPGNPKPHRRRHRRHKHNHHRGKAQGHRRHHRAAASSRRTGR